MASEAPPPEHPGSAGPLRASLRPAGSQGIDDGRLAGHFPCRRPNDRHFGAHPKPGRALGERVVFDGPTEKWIVWPPPPSGRSRRNPELAANAIRVVVYREEAGSYEFTVGSRVPTSRAATRT